MNSYDINLNIEKLSWGSVAPDVLPYYRLIRHYKDESIDYISKEIVMLIHLFRYTDLNKLNKVQNDYLSKKIGIISHYLSDYTCYPHAHRKTYINGMREHMKYESDLNRYSTIHEFKNIIVNDIDVDESGKLVEIVKAYIEKVVNNYLLEEPSFSNDLDYALLLSYQVAAFIVETIKVYNEDMEYRLI